MILIGGRIFEKCFATRHERLVVHAEIDGYGMFSHVKS